MKERKAVIFDLDGVIVDTAKFHFTAWREMANELGFDIDLKQNEKLKGVSRARSLEQILNWGNVEVDEAEFEELMTGKNKNYLKLISSLSKEDLLPGIENVLDYLSERQIPFALGSASRNARPILRSLDIYDRFAAIVDGNDVNRAKPNPEVFLIAAEKLGIKPQECVVFEDAEAGIEAAKAAGMLSIGIGDRNVLHEADFVFTDSTQIEEEFLENIFKK